MCHQTMGPILPIKYVSVVESSEILHRVRQYHWRTLWKFENDFTTEMGVTDKENFARFEFTMSFDESSYIAIAPDSHGTRV